MIDKRTEFPWLDARISYLEHMLFQVQQQVDAQVYDGKLDAAAQKWLSDTRTELAEFQYIQRKLSPQGNRIEIAGFHLVLYMVLIMSIVILMWQIFGN